MNQAVDVEDAVAWWGRLVHLMATTEAVSDASDVGASSAPSEAAGPAGEHEDPPISRPPTHPLANGPACYGRLSWRRTAMSRGIQPTHLRRRAYVYIRQSTGSQVLENVESTQRQYALADRAKALGWLADEIEVIDEDLGKSGATTQGRTGLGKVAEAVAQGRAGAILALEVSRLARCSTDWQHLLKLCAVAEVVVIDEQTVYDPRDHDDKLLLDLKGTISEVELSWLSLRLAGARRNKARRGELRMTAPTGYVWSAGGFALDPDESVRQAIRVVFERFRVEPSAMAVVQWAQRTGFEFPTERHHAGGGRDVVWKPLGVSRLADLLHNPTYAGVYAYGRRSVQEVIRHGEIQKTRPRTEAPDAWAVRIDGAHPGYITWATYLKNQEKLEENFKRTGSPARGAPKEGAALLTGILICGRCGRRMIANYGRRGALGRRFYYVCAGDRAHGDSMCWVVNGPSIDTAVEQILLQTVAPSELELTLAVEQHACRQGEELARQWKLRIERCEYDARIAERRYKTVDPENRVVARTLEQDWEVRLRSSSRCANGTRWRGAKRRSI